MKINSRGSFKRFKEKKNGFIMLCTAERIKYNEDQKIAISLGKMKVIGELKGS